MIIRLGNKSAHKIQKMSFLEFFLPIYSVLIYYTLPVAGSVGQVILFAYVLLYLLFNRRREHRILKWLFIFTVLVIPVQLLVFSDIGGFNLSRMINLLMIVVYLLLLSIFEINIKRLMFMYKIVAAIASVLIIIQFIQINFMGQVVHQIMLFSFKRSELWYQEGLRPQGLFPEPQVYATFILPLLVLCLKEAEYKWAVFLSISIFVSTSSLGILCTFGIWIYYMLTTSMKTWARIGILATVIVMLVVLLESQMFDYAVNKLMNTNYTQNVRLTRGFTIYGKLPLKNKLFGIGVNNLDYYADVGLISLNDSVSRAMRNPAYITTASELLINYGLIATSIYSLMLINFWKNSEIRLLVVLLVVLSFGQTILFSGVWFLFVIIIVSTLKKPNDTFFNVAKRNRSL